MVCRVFGNVGNLPTMFPTCQESDGLWEHWTGSQTTRNQLATLLTLGTRWFNLLGGWRQRARDTSHWMNRFEESISFTESWLNVKYKLLLCLRPEKAIFWGWRPHSLTRFQACLICETEHDTCHMFIYIYICLFHLLTCLEKIAASHRPRKDAMVINAMSHLVYQTVRYVMSPECLSSISSIDEKLELSGTFYNFLQLSSSLLSLHSVEFSAKPSAFWTWIRSQSCFCSKRQMTRKFHEFWHGIGETGETGFSNSQATAKPEWYHSIWVEEPSELEWDVTPRRCSKAIHGITRKVSSETAFQKLRV